MWGLTGLGSASSRIATRTPNVTPAKLEAAFFTRSSSRDDRRSRPARPWPSFVGLNVTLEADLRTRQPRFGGARVHKHAVACGQLWMAVSKFSHFASEGRACLWRGPENGCHVCYMTAWVYRLLKSRT